MIRIVLTSALLLAIGIGAGFVVGRSPQFAPSPATTPEIEKAAAPASEPEWVAAAPGRVEPVSGEIKISASAAGQIDGIFVKPRDRVQKGDLLAIIDDREQHAHVKSAEAEVTFREAERDTALSAAVPNERRIAEDRVAKTESDLRLARAQLDLASIAASMPAAIAAARANFGVQELALKDAQSKLLAIVTAPDATRPNRTESALAVARSELAIATAAFDKTRVRAPRDGSVLQVLRLAGDTASTASEDVLVTMGDMSRLRVKVELDENEAGNIVAGQHVVIRSDAFPNKDFSGIVSLIGAAARPRTLTGPNAIPATKDNALEVIAELEAAAELVPGMRIDAFFEAPSLAESKGEPYGSN